MNNIRRRHYFYNAIHFVIMISSVAVVARPCAIDGIYDQENCIPMNAAREVEIQDIVSKISDYAGELAMEHKFFDIRLMKFAIEKHSPYEPEDKNVEIQVTVNDCAADERSNANAGDGSSNANAEVNKDPRTETSNTDLALAGTEVQSSAKPELIHLNLDDDGQQLLQKIDEVRGHKNPFIVLLLGDEYVFV